jgi:hypothetical protein
LTEQEGSFAARPEQLEEHRELARELVGLVLERVRYVDIDYHRTDRAPDHRGPRLIVEDAEWLNPTWQYDTFDSIDHGVEFETTGARLFTVTWDSPGWTEGISIRERPLIGYAVVDDAEVAVWEVTARSGWARFIGRPVTGVALHYVPWESPAATGFWCARISLTIDTQRMHLILAEARAPAFTLSPSADNVAVVFPPHDPPDWEDGPSPDENNP